MRRINIIIHITIRIIATAAVAIATIIIMINNIATATTTASTIAAPVVDTVTAPIVITRITINMISINIPMMLTCWRLGDIAPNG